MKFLMTIAAVMSLSLSVGANAQTKKTTKKTKTTTTTTESHAAPAEQKAPAQHEAPVAAPSHSSGGGESYGGAPWGMAGCSIWNYVIKDKETGPQIGVWVLENVVFGVQTFAISSGTSNCVGGGGSMASNEQEVFVNVNMASLQKEAAQGQGEHLTTLAEIFGCSDKTGFAQMSQNRYETIFTHENAADIIQSFKIEIKSSKMADTCSRAG